VYHRKYSFYVSLSVLVFFSGSVWGGSLYLVRKGDTLSGIAKRYFGSPIYGRSGSLSVLLFANPNIKNPDRIFIGDKITIAKKEIQTENLPSIPTSEVPSPIFHNEFELRADLFFSGMSLRDFSSGASAIFFSSLNVGLTGFWQQRWSPKWKSFFSVGIERQSYSGPSNRTFQNSEQFYYQLGVGLSHEWPSGHSLSIEGGVAEVPFVTVPSLTTVSISRVPVGRLSGYFLYRFLSLSPFDLLSGLRVGWLLPSSTSDFTINSGAFYRAEITLKKTQVPYRSWFGRIYYGQSFQNTSSFSFSFQSMGLQLGIELH